MRDDNMTDVSLINRYHAQSETIVKDNANFNIAFSGMQSYISAQTFKQHAFNLLDDEDHKLIDDGAIYLHNTSEGMQIPYCMGLSLPALLMQGIQCAGITSNPAKHMDTIIDHCINYLFMMTDEASGAIALGDFNSLLAPFVHYDGLNYHQVKQNIQRFVFSVNYPIRSNFQSAFTNLTFNLRCPKQLAEMPVIIGGKPQDRTYADFENEADMIFETFLDVIMAGDGDGRPMTFPLPTVNLVKDVDKDSNIYKKILDNVQRLGSLYFMNFTNGFIDEDTVRAMCCRLNLNLEELSKARGSWNTFSGTGSLGIVTLNMSRIGYLARHGVDLYRNIDHLLQSARRILNLKRKIVQRNFDAGLMPFSKFYHLNLNHYFNTIGVLGFNELFVNLNDCPILGIVPSQKEAGEILDYINAKLRQFQIEDGVLYNLEMIPGESSSGELAWKDKQKYPDIFTQGTDENPYYTTLLSPPNDVIFWTFRAEYEAELLPKFSGGTTHRIYLAREDTLDSVEFMIDTIASKTIPYFDFTPTIAYCPKCQKREISIEEFCSTCGGRNELYSRVVGYIRPVVKWAKHKQQEFRDRAYIN
jgi:ribonucleoside-triphosphate reductase